MLDNICACVCRLMMGDLQAVSMQQVWPMVLRCLPLREDHDEYKTVLRCVAGLLQQREAHVLDSMPALTRTMIDCIASDKIKPDSGNRQTCLQSFLTPSLS